jgi:hypothetical protein
VERLKRINIAPILSRWGALGSLAIGILSFLLGAALVAKHANSNDGSPFGWLFIVIGICGLLAAFGFVTGLYD